MTRRQRCGTTRPRPACRHWRATPTTSGVARGGVTAQLLLGVAPARLQPTRHFPTHFGCSCVAFHPQLPIIPTGSEDGAVGWCPAQTHINTHNSHTRSHLKLRRVPPGAAHHPDRLRGRRRQDVARDHVQVRLAEAVSCGFRTNGGGQSSSALNKPKQRGCRVWLRTCARPGTYPLAPQCTTNRIAWSACGRTHTTQTHTTHT